MAAVTTPSQVPQEQLRSRLAQLQQQLRIALSDKRARIQAIVALCRSERAAMREQLRDRRRQALEQVDHDIQAARAGAKLVRLSRLAEARKGVDSDIAAARAAIAVERQHQEELRRIGHEHRRRRAEVSRLHEVTAQGVTLHAAVLGHFAPLFQRVAPKPLPGESRAEAMLRYAQTHPTEAHAATEPRAEQLIESTRRQIAQTKTALRSAPRTPKAKASVGPTARPRAIAPTPFKPVASATKRGPATPKTQVAAVASRALAPPVAPNSGDKLSLRRPGQLPRGGGGMRLDELLRERDALAERRAAPKPPHNKPSKPQRAPTRAPSPPTPPAPSAAKAPVVAPSAKPTPAVAPPASSGAPAERTVKAPEVRDTAQIAKLIRQDIKAAVAAGELPKVTYSVTTDKYSMGSSIDVGASKLPFPVLNDKAFVLDGQWARFNSAQFRSRFTPEAEALLKKLEDLVGAYHWDRSEPQTDYYNQRFHKDIKLDDRGELERITKALLARAAEKSDKPAAPVIEAVGAKVIPFRPRRAGKPVSSQQTLFSAAPPVSKESEEAKVPLSPGDRVRWSPAFLATGRRTDPRWYEEQKLALGRVDAVQRDGDVLVLWDGADTTTVHPPARLVRAGKT